MKVIAKNSSVFKQGFAEFALPGFVSVARLLQLPPLVVEEGEAAKTLMLWPRSTNLHKKV